MNWPFLNAQAHDLTARLWHDLPTDTDITEFVGSVSLYMETFLVKLHEDNPVPHQRLAYVRRRAKLIYDNEVWQVHHEACDEQFLRHMIEQSLCDLLGDKDLRRQVDGWNSLHASASLYLANHSNERRGKLIDEYRTGLYVPLWQRGVNYVITYQQ